MTQEPWEIEDARREREAREELEIFGPRPVDTKTLELDMALASRDCDVCLYDRHCVSHCPEDCMHRQVADPSDRQGEDPYWMFR